MFISPSIWQGWNFPKVVSPEHFLSAGLRIISNLHSALTLLTPQRRREKALDDYIAPFVPSPLHLKKVLLKRFPKECTSDSQQFQQQKVLKRSYFGGNYHFRRNFSPFGANPKIAVAIFLIGKHQKLWNALEPPT